MSTGSINFFDIFSIESSGTVNLASGSFSVLLTTSTWTPLVATHNRVDDVTNQVTTNLSAARPALANVTWTDIGGGIGQFNSDNPVFTASGGSVTAHRYVLFDNTTGADSTRPLIAWGLLDTTAGGTDVTVTATNTITINVNANGWFRHTLTDA